VWWFTSVIPTLRRLRQEDGKFKDSLEYLPRPCLKKSKSKENKKCIPRMRIKFPSTSSGMQKWR
jgi:hypothetical protein